MFENFDPRIFTDRDFKEDSVREVIIVPMLSRLGYFPTGRQTVVRSKNLIQPFIYVGTRRHVVNIIPDYTLYFDGRPIAVLDAKSPTESVDSPANVQQAYSYAIHPEVRANHFALCNGRWLVVYNINSTTPLINIAFEEFASRWGDIVKHLAPKFLLEPELRSFKPDFGFRVSRLGFAPNAELIMIGARLNTFARVSDDLYSAAVNLEFAGEGHCVSFDFAPEQLPQLVGGLPETLRDQFLEALSRAPFQACADLVIEVDLRTHLGEPIELEHETFVPLVIDEVLAARFNPFPPEPGPTDVPPHIFRLGQAFKIVAQGDQENA
jgi:hypothetical protein